MRIKFKQLALASAVALASVGTFATEQQPPATLSTTGLGDMAIVPYYTVQDTFVTGLHITNTSDLTQVVKLRLRRATDSMDALDFNIVMSPEDAWTAYLTKDEDGRVTLNTKDTTCTAPEIVNAKVTMPDLYSLDAGTGYIEVIGMGSADAAQPISVAALHGTDGTPADCNAVASNFFANNSVFNVPAGDASKKGVMSSISANQQTSVGVVNNRFGDTGNVLRVSYFIRNHAEGQEFGSDAVHFNDFMKAASITNQQRGVFDADFQGFDFPDLNGGAPLSALNGIGGQRGKYEEIRAAIGGGQIVNDWAARTDSSEFSINTDWVVTIPGQYTMLDLPGYLSHLAGLTPACGAGCDNRDIPLTASFNVFDREERGIVSEDGDLVISPTLPIDQPVSHFPHEVNVVQWSGSSALSAPTVLTVEKPEGAINGWAKVNVTSSTAKTQQICDFTLDAETPVSCTPVDDVAAVPLVGFVAWERNFSVNPAANYGRMINHSVVTASIN